MTLPILNNVVNWALQLFILFSSYCLAVLFLQSQLSH